MEQLLTMEPPSPAFERETNSISWVGHFLINGKDQYKLAGQTFKSPLNGWLRRIDIYTSGIQHPGVLELTLHPFDDMRHQWQEELARSSLLVARNGNDPWITMALNQARLERDRYYGFRLQSRDALLALGERARTAGQPILEGEEWMANTENREGDFFHYFNLVFRLGIQT